MASDKTRTGPKRGSHPVFLCEQIVDLGGGRSYVCGRHTKNRDRLCTQHRVARRKEAGT